MRIECKIVDGKVQVPKEWLKEWERVVGLYPDTVVFDLSDNSPKVPAGVFLIRKHLEHG
jgi:hypothetical protein